MSLFLGFVLVASFINYLIPQWKNWETMHLCLSLDTQKRFNVVHCSKIPPLHFRSKDDLVGTLQISKRKQRDKKGKRNIVL